MRKAARTRGKGVGVRPGAGVFGGAVIAFGRKVKEAVPRKKGENRAKTEKWQNAPKGQKIGRIITWGG